ncbi:MAG: N-acetylglucosamine-6-phosphate deacetylase, partial [Eubacterium sp.]
LFNAMAPFTHREPGLVGAASDAENVMVELISDGAHIHPAMIRAAFKIFTDDRMVLISDSMMATGLSDGEYSLGGQAVHVSGNLAT